MFNTKLSSFNVKTPVQSVINTSVKPVFVPPVRLTSNPYYSLWERLESQHYKAIRAAVREFKRKIPRVMLDVISKKAPPRM